MNRILQATPATISESWYQGATIQDPGTVTVTVTSDDGTTVATGTATGTGATPRSFQLTAANTAKLDRLKASWASSSLGTLTTIIEVVGDFLFTINDARSAGLAVGTYPDDVVAETRIRSEQMLENACGVAFVPRYDRMKITRRVSFATTSHIDGEWHSRATVRLRPMLRAIRWVTVDAVALATADVQAIAFDDLGFADLATWSTPYSTVIVGFEHGMDTAPEPVHSAALDYAKFLLTKDASIDDRAERLITDDGTLFFGSSGLGVPDVDRVIEAYRLPSVA